MADLVGQLSKTKEALYALGPSAVEAIKQAIDNGVSGPIGQAKLDAALQVLDRMGLNRQGAI